MSDQGSRRRIALAALLLLGACAQNQAIKFRNPATGEVVAACGPLTGLAVAVTATEHACTEGYDKRGWVRLPPEQGTTRP